MKAIIINPPRRLGIIFLLILLMLIITIGCYYFYIKSFLISADELVEEALSKAFEANSYRYKLKSQLCLEGEGQVWSDISGEKANQHDLHIVGTIVNTPFEFYQIGKVSYNKDPITNKWFAVEGYDLTQQEILLSEVNPLSNFNFKEIVVADYVGKEKINGKNCWILNCTVDLENQLLQVLWEDFNFKFWIDQQQHLLRKGELTAKSKNNSKSFLSITVEFYDYNEEINFEVPEV